MNDETSGAEPDDAEPEYLNPEQIQPMALASALTSLELLSDDPWMRMQAHNLDIVDTFLMGLEYEVLGEWFRTDRTPADTHFLQAQSQMWIFAAYELLRTWHQRARDIIKWSQGGGLEQKLKALKDASEGYTHFGREVRISQLEKVKSTPGLVDKIQSHLRILHITFSRLEYIRVSIAKHEISGRAKSVAMAPGYGRINTHCGSLDFQLENGKYIMGTISRRDIADELRAVDVRASPPSQDTLDKFDAYMEGRINY